MGGNASPEKLALFFLPFLSFLGRLSTRVHVETDADMHKDICICSSTWMNLSGRRMLSLADANPKGVDQCTGRRFNQNPDPHATLRDLCSSRWVNLSSRRMLSSADAKP